MYHSLALSIVDERTSRHKSDDTKIEHTQDWMPTDDGDDDDDV